MSIQHYLSLPNYDFNLHTESSPLAVNSYYHKEECLIDAIQTPSDISNISLESEFIRGKGPEWIIKVVNTAFQLSQDLRIKRLFNDQISELLKVSAYIHTFADGALYPNSSWIKKCASGPLSSIIIDSKSFKAYLIPKKQPLDHAIAIDRCQMVIRDGFEINPLTNKITLISILNNRKGMDFSQAEKKAIKLFGNEVGHIKLHNLFTVTKIRIEQSLPTLHTKTYACIDNYSHTLLDMPIVEWSQHETLSLIQEIVKGVAITHEKGVVHNNINSKHILIHYSYAPDLSLRPTFSTALGHWDLAYSEANSPIINNQFYGVVEHTAPELLKKGARALDATTLAQEFTHDIYALGIILLEFIFQSNSIEFGLRKNIRGANQFPPLENLDAYKSRSLSYQHEIRGSLLAHETAMTYSPTILREFNRLTTLGDLLDWYKTHVQILNNDEKQIAQLSLGIAYNTLYLNAKELIESRFSNPNLYLIRQALGIIVEMINPDPKMRPTSQQALEMLHQIR